MNSELISPDWFNTNAHNWVFVKRLSARDGNEFYFLYEENDPNKGMVYFPDNSECKFHFIKIEEIPDNIKEHLLTLGIIVTHPDVLPLPIPRNNRQGSYTIASGRLRL